MAFILIAAIQAYGPALHGPFVFDDLTLPYYNPTIDKAHFMSWIGGVRPLLMLSFWLNYQWAGNDTFTYHLFGLAFHLINAGLVFLIARRLLKILGGDDVRRGIAAGFAGLLFLMHPVQTESVAYIASRSETLSALFFLSAFTLYLYRSESGVGWGRAVAIVALYGAAVATKEHAAMLPVTLLALSFWGFQSEGLRATVKQNWRLYAPLVAFAALAVLVVIRVLMNATSAGFRVSGLGGPLDYFWTECGVLLTYLGLCLLPLSQTVDYDFPWAHGPFAAGTLIGLATLALLIAAAWRWRERYPVVSFGIALFLLLLAPTSSFIPLADPAAEHRLYLPMVGVCLIAAEASLRWFAGRANLLAVASAVLLAASLGTYHRNFVWGSESALWADATRKAPDKLRGYSHLIHGLVTERHCVAALDKLNDLDRRGKVDSTLLIHWSFALECVHDYASAIEKLRRAGPSEAVNRRIAELEARSRARRAEAGAQPITW